MLLLRWDWSHTYPLYWSHMSLGALVVHLKTSVKPHIALKWNIQESWGNFHYLHVHLIIISENFPFLMPHLALWSSWWESEFKHLCVILPPCNFNQAAFGKSLEDSQIQLSLHPLRKISSFSSCCSNGPSSGTPWDNSILKIVRMV